MKPEVEFQERPNEVKVELLKNVPNYQSKYETFVAGVISGSLGRTLTNPLERLKVIR